MNNKIINIKKYNHIDKMFVLDESTVLGDGLSFVDLCKQLMRVFNIKCYYNCNFINKDNERLTMEDILKHTHVNMKRKGRRTCCLVSSNSTMQKQLETHIKNLQRYLYEYQKLNGYSFRLYNEVPIDNTSDSEIYNIMSDVWNKLNINDDDDNCPMIDSYCKAMGFALTNDMSKRYFVCLFSKIKGWGKTAFTNVLLRHTNGVYGQYGQKKTINQFSMSDIAGKDFYQLDDISFNNQTDMCGNINNVVSNFTTNREKKGKDEEYLTNVICRIIITTNIPFIPRDDTTGLCDTKMIEITSNTRDILSTKECMLVSKAVEQINNLPQSEFDKFYNLCVKLYNEDEGFIERHLRANKLRDEVLECSIAEMFDYESIKKAKAGDTLTSILKSEYIKSKDDPRRSVIKEELKQWQISYAKVCDSLDRKFNPKSCSYDKSYCLIYNSNKGPSYKRNFIITNDIIEFIKDHLDSFYNNHDNANKSLNDDSFDAQRVYSGKYEDLFDL